MARKKIEEGYGETSEQRQRHLRGDNFSERGPRTPAEAEAVRGTPDKDGTVVKIHPLEDEDEPDLWRGEP
ncbi:hypothetical protein LY474_25495 [Myxococcus stipitatus]|uniref:hypothetical protein n=1 Tax=Myxococcus stipitatus TaxID=83455 RepID=UPI001F46C457|nr:hypothetical protein [Myxococcus stipitatus]MCE9671169.1 hypothetical protein [Myxococcus stipitatus]